MSNPYRDVEPREPEPLVEVAREIEEVRLNIRRRFDAGARRVTVTQTTWATVVECAAEGFAPRSIFESNREAWACLVGEYTLASDVERVNFEGYELLVHR